MPLDAVSDTVLPATPESVPPTIVTSPTGAALQDDDWYYPQRIAAHAAWLREDDTLDFLAGRRDADRRASKLDFSVLSRNAKKPTGQAF